MRQKALRWSLILLLAGHAAASAGEPVVEAVEAHEDPVGTWRFDVTVRHADEGWDHYADRWVVLTPDGRILGERVLLHPHEYEQPFTRSLGGVAIPPGTREVLVQAHDSVHGLGPAVTVPLGP